MRDAPFLGVLYSYANGNMATQTRTDGITPLTPYMQSYTFDALNRVTGVIEGGVPLQSYGYDQWGNWWLTSSTLPVHAATPKGPGFYDTATNRLARRGTGPGVALPVDAYDAAGNLTNHPDLGVFTYDAEGRMRTAVAGEFRR